MYVWKKEKNERWKMDFGQFLTRLRTSLSLEFRSLCEKVRRCRVKHTIQDFVPNRRKFLIENFFFIYKLNLFKKKTRY